MNPHPGSPEAVAQGCTCPIIDNNHGEGFVYDGAVMFWYADDCPLHGLKAQPEAENAGTWEQGP